MKPMFSLGVRRVLGGLIPIRTVAVLVFVSVATAHAQPASIPDDARIKSGGIRQLEGQHLTLYTDVPSSPEVDRLPAVFDAAVPQTGPLPGAYARSALPVLERRLAAGELALRGALDELDVRVVRLPSASLANVNTPDDLDRI